MLLDATQNYEKSLTARKLKGWQAALFPTGYSGLRKIQTGHRRSAEHAMQVVSGAVGREKVHCEAPPGEKKVSRATAFREISDLLEKGILRQNPAKGRSVNYDLKI